MIQAFLADFVIAFIPEPPPGSTARDTSRSDWNAAQDCRSFRSAGWRRQSCSITVSNEWQRAAEQNRTAPRSELNRNILAVIISRYTPVGK